MLKKKGSIKHKVASRSEHFIMSQISTNTEKLYRTTGKNCMYEFHPVSENRHCFYHKAQKPSKIKNVGQYFYTFTLLMLQETPEKTKRAFILNQY